jgi:hypothetical protein
MNRLACRGGGASQLSPTADMNTVAAKMGSATEFISNVAAFGTAANKVVSALKGAG